MWRRAYKIAMAQLKSKTPPPNLSRGMAVSVLEKLFPIPIEEVFRQDSMHGIACPHRLLTQGPKEWSVAEGELREVVVRLDIEKTTVEGQYPTNDIERHREV